MKKIYDNPSIAPFLNMMVLVRPPIVPNFLISYNSKTKRGIDINQKVSDFCNERVK